MRRAMLVFMALLLLCTPSLAGASARGVRHIEVEQQSVGPDTIVMEGTAAAPAPEPEPTAPPAEGQGEDSIQVEGSTPAPVPNRDASSEENTDSRPDFLVSEGLQIVLESRAEPSVGRYGAGTVVYSTDALRTALTSTDLTDTWADASDGGRITRVIYLGFTPGENGQAAGATADSIFVMGTSAGMKLPSTIDKLILCGTAPGASGRVTLSDWNTEGYLNTIYPSKQGQRFLLADMDIRGYNYYGTVYGSLYAGTWIEYNNIEYEGRQPLHNIGAANTCVVQDSAFVVRQYGGRTAQEFMEGDRLIIRGNVSVTRNAQQYIDDLPLFQVTSTQTGLTVEAGATFTVDTGIRRFMAGGSASVTDVIVEGTFVLNGQGQATGILAYGDTLHEVRVGSQGRLVINEGNASSHASGMAINANIVTLNGIVEISYAPTSGDGRAINARQRLVIGDGAAVNVWHRGGTGATVVSAAGIDVYGTLRIEQDGGGARAISYGTGADHQLNVFAEGAVHVTKNANTTNALYVVYGARMYVAGTMDVAVHAGGTAIHLTQVATSDAMRILHVPGRLTVNKAGGSGNAIFAGNLKIGDESDAAAAGLVTVTQASGDTALLIGTNTYNRIDVYQGNNALVVGKTGGAGAVINSTRAFVYSNARMEIDQSSGDGTFTGVNALSVLFGGTLRVTRTGGSTSPVFSIVQSGNAAIMQPARATIENANGPIALSAGAYQTSVSILASAINYDRNGVRHVWNNGDLSIVSLTSTISRTATATNVTTLGDGQRGAAPFAQDIAQTIDLTSATGNRLDVGQFNRIAIDVPYRDSSLVSGSAPGADRVEIEEYSLFLEDIVALRQRSEGWVPVAGGSFSHAMPMNLDIARTRIYIHADRGGLEAYSYRNSEGMVWLDIPEPLRFQGTGVLLAPDVIDREDPDWRVTVHDTRGYSDGVTWHAYPWAVMVRVLGPFADETGMSTLADSRIGFTPPGGSPVLLEPSASGGVEVASGTFAAEGEYERTLRWAAGEGFRFYQAAGEGEYDRTYSATMEWSVVIP